MKKAFTIIELLVVIGILGILSAIVVGTFGGSTESARAAKCLSNMRNLAMAVQSVGMSTEYYPSAGSYKRYTGQGTKRTTGEQNGWISWTRSCKYDPTSQEDLEYCITNGSIWTSIKGARECYVCPTQIKSGDANWSYAMNAYFGWASKSAPRHESYHGRYYKTFRRSDRFLLFAEIASSSSGEADEGEKKRDPILQYSGCDGGGDEEIGFNHTDSKKSVAHVCFADGHVEKLRQPSEGDVKELTKWLCCPQDSNGDFDISFDGKQYQKVQ